MRRHVFSLIEEILRDFPRICISLNEREDYIETMLNNIENLLKNCGGEDPLTVKKRTLRNLKRVDCEYQELLAIVETIGDALRELPQKNLTVLMRCYFHDWADREIANRMSRNIRWVQKKRNNSVWAMKEPCLRIYALIEKWRARERKRGLEITRILMNTA